VSLSIRFLLFALSGNKISQNPLLIEFFYHINIGLVATLLLSTFIVWKRLILYQKSKYLERAWQVFEYAVLISILFNLFEYVIFDAFFNSVLFIVVAMGIILSVNLKWI